MSGTEPAAVQAFGRELALARQAVDEFALRSTRERSTPDPMSAMALSLEGVKTSARNELQTREDMVAAAQPGPAQDRAAEYGVRAVWRIVGQHGYRVQLIDRRPFDVVPTFESDNTISDLAIQVREVPIPADAAVLKTEIDSALNIIKSVMADRLKHLSNRNRLAAEADLLASQRGYMRDLLGLAQVGLMTSEPTHITFARNDLVQLKARFTMREAGMVKNAYIARLFGWSSLAAAFFLGCYVLTRHYAGPHAAEGGWAALLYDLRNFELLAVGTAIGTWLSFSLRKQELTFDDLAVLEPDRLNPSVRVAYMIGLASLVGLLLFSGAVIAGVGTVHGSEALHQKGSWALLIGLLAGVAERTLGSAVSRRAGDFAGAVGGTDAATKVNV